MNETKRIEQAYREGKLSLAEVEKRLLQAGHTRDDAQAIIYDLVAEEELG